MNLKEVKVKDYCKELIRGVNCKKDDISNTKTKGYIPLLRSNNISLNEADVNFVDLKFVNKNEVPPKKILKRGDIIYVTSSGSEKLVGKAAYIASPKREMTVSAFTSIIRLSQEISNRYFFYIFTSPLFKKHISKQHSGVNINNIKKSDVLNFKFSLPFKNGKPDLEEQKRIADKIDKLFEEIDRGIKTTKNNLELSKRILKSEIDKEFNNKEYREYKMDDLFEINWGDTSITKKSYTDDGFPAYSATGQDGYLKNYQNSGEAIVLSAIGARCGKCFLASGKWTAIKNTIVIKAKNEKSINYKFFYYYLNDENKWRSKGAGQPFISQTKAKNIKVFVPINEDGKPDLEEQKKVSNELDEISEKSKELQEQYKAQLKNFKQLKESLLQQAFQGKL